MVRLWYASFALVWIVVLCVFFRSLYIQQWGYFHNSAGFLKIHTCSALLAECTLWFDCSLVVGIDVNYRVITLLLKKYGNLPLCLENYVLFLLPPNFTTILFTYPLSYIIYLGEPSGNIISDYHGTSIHIFMHGYYPIYEKKFSKPSFSWFIQENLYQMPTLL